MAAGSSAVISGVVINAVITLVCLTLFSLLRGAKLLKKYYAPKRFSKEQAVKPRKLPTWYLSWVLPVLRYPERDIIEESGLDSAIYLRVLTYSTEVMGYLSVWCLAAVLPVNLTGGEIDVLMPDGPATNGTSSDDSQYSFTDFDKLSLSNVAAGSPRLWVHLASVYAVTIIVVWALWRYNRETVLLRLMYLANAEPAAEAHTVLVTDIPGIRPEDEPQDYDDEEGHGAGGAAAAAAGQQGGTTSATIKKMEMVSPHASETSDRPLVSGSLHGATFLPTPGGDSPGSHASPLPPTAGASEDTGRGSASGAAVNGSSATNGSGASAAAAVGNGVGSTTASARADDGGEGGGAAAGGSGTSQVTVQAGRKVSRYPYDLKDHSLQPRWQARKALASGVSPHDFVEHEFRSVYPPGSIVAVNMVTDCEELTPLVNEFNKVQMALEDYLDECEHRLRLGLPTARKKLLVLGGKYGEWGKARGYGRFHKVDALDHWTARLQELRRVISEGQTRAIRRPSAAAFVTFSSRWYQTVAATSLHANDTTVWSVQPAPIALEVVWQNLAWPAWRRASQSALMWGLFWLMACFYIIPIAALQGLIDVPNLAKSDGLAAFFNAPVVKQLVEAIVPGLALKVFLLLVPFLLAAMVRASGAISQYRIDFGVVSRFFIFQIIVVFFGSVISSSFFSQLEQWINDPASVVTVLGTSVPQGTTFFITYVLVLMGAGSVAFLRLPGLLLFGLLTWLSGSPRARTRLWQRQYTMLGNTVVGHMMVLLYGIVFCVINPVMCPVALLYFVVAAVQERYNMIYVFRRHYDSAGRLWGTVFHQVMIMVYLFQAVLLGLLAVKKFPYSPLLLPLMAATAASHYVAVKRFAQPWKVIALHDAASLDRLEAEQVKAMTAAASLAGEAFQERPLGSMSRRPLLPTLSSASSSAAAIDAMDVDLSQEQPHADEKWAVPLSVEEEARRVQGAYLAPPFKVPLDVVDKLTAAAAEMAARVDEAAADQLRGAKRGPKSGPPAAVEPLRLSAQPPGGLTGPDTDNDVEAGKGHQRRQPRQSEGDTD